MVQYVLLSEKGKIAAIREYRSKSPMEFESFFDAFMDTDYFVREQFASTEVMVGVPAFSLIPNGHFDESRLKAFAAATLKAELGEDDLLHRELPTVGAAAIFSIPSSVKRKCDASFNGAVYMPMCNPAVNMALDLAKEKPDLILIYIFGNQFILTAIQEGKLHLCNAYSYNGVTDIVYFVQLVMEVVKADPSKTSILISGEFERDSELMRQSLKLIPQIRIPEQPLQNRFTSHTESLPHWRYAFLSY